MKPLPDSPLVTIVTPSYNQAAFLKRTLESVARQSYPHIEHLVFDGGSTDRSVDILREFAAHQDPARFFWVTEGDKGQADAINKGLARARGDILAYLNSDDLYAPDTVEKVVSFFRSHPEAGFVHGQGQHIDAEDRLLDPYPSRACSHAELGNYCYVCQPTAFWRREVYGALGGCDTSLRYGMDYDYWIRLSSRFPMGFLYDTLAFTRIHADAKTVGERRRMHREILSIVKRHYGRVSYHWIYAYAHTLPRVEQCRYARTACRWLYAPVFAVASFCLFIKWNHRVPLRMLRHFRHVGKRSEPTKIIA